MVCVFQITILITLTVKLRNAVENNNISLEKVYTLDDVPLFLPDEINLHVQSEGPIVSQHCNRNDWNQRVNMEGPIGCHKEADRSLWVYYKISNFMLVMID